MANSESVDFWRRVMAGGRYSTWVVFEHGTCVVIRTPGPDLAEQARTLLAEWPTQPGGAGGDFSVRRLRDFEEQLVLCGHPDILNYVTASELEAVKRGHLPADKEVVLIGVGGRHKRHLDAKALHVIHVEHAPSLPGP